jgi:hypothetical protein
MSKFDDVQSIVADLRGMIPSGTDTAKSIDRNDSSGEIASNLRSDFRHGIIQETPVLSVICDQLETDEQEWWNDEDDE